MKRNLLHDSHKRSMLKSLVWRVIGVFWLAGITWIFTHSWIAVSLITFIHHGIFLVVFYLHERAWQNSKLSPKWKFAAKAFTYEIILGNVILGLITYVITGDVKAMTAITLTYIQSKLVLYFFYDWMWYRATTVYAYVVADIFHEGHLRHLKAAKKLGDRLIVGVLSDKATEEKKDPPIVPFHERRNIIEALKCVDKVVIQDKYSPLENIKEIKPNVLAESEDHAEQPANEFVRSYGGEVKALPYWPEQSSTKIKEKIIKRHNRA